MLIYNRQAYSEVNGPGVRAVIWLAGCDLGCPGCWNQNTHKFDETKDIPTRKVASWLTSIKDIEGYTLSGGEPLQHAGHVLDFINLVKQPRPDLSFGMYTGYSLKELEAGKFKWRGRSKIWHQGDISLWQDIKRYLDFAVMGRYNQLVRVQDNSQPLLGSLNQEIVFFSDRYTKDDLKGGYEVIIPKDGLTSGMTGFPVSII